MCVRLWSNLEKAVDSFLEAMGLACRPDNLAQIEHFVELFGPTEW